MFWYGDKNLLRMFRSGNVIVAGHKGRGKDLLFQYVISRREKDGEIHASNIPYTPNTKLRSIKFYELHQNNYKNFISGKFDTSENKQFIEEEDFYISDVGNALPSHFGRTLEKEYPTLPITYSLSRHLANFSIHCNAQNFLRVWDKLREQADYYIWCEKAIVLFHKIVIQRYVVYDRYQTAINNIQPYKTHRRMLGIVPPTKEDLARAHEHNARYGTIKRRTMWHILPKEHYDTRIYHKLIYGKDAPKKDKRKKRKK